MNELISIVVPVYNVEKYLPRCVESLLAQTYENIEVILVDDGSPDGCPSLCDGFARRDSRVRVLHQENRGVSAARCAGIEAAAGEYIGFVDGDDYVEPDMYTFLHDLMMRTGADIAQCGFDQVNGERVTSNATHEEKLVTGREAIKGVLNGGIVWASLWPKLYKMELFDNKKLDFGLRISEDGLANYYLFRDAKAVAFSDMEKYHYVARPDSALRQTYPAYWITDPFKFFDQAAKEEGAASELAPAIRAGRLKHCLSHAMYILYLDLNREYLDGLMAEIKAGKSFMRQNSDLFGREDKLKMALLTTNKKLAKFVYTKIREGRK